MFILCNLGTLPWVLILTLDPSFNPASYYDRGKRKKHELALNVFSNIWDICLIFHQPKQIMWLHIQIGRKEQFFQGPVKKEFMYLWSVLITIMLRILVTSNDIYMWEIMSQICCNWAILHLVFVMFIRFQKSCWGRKWYKHEGVHIFPCSCFMSWGCKARPEELNSFCALKFHVKTKLKILLV